MLIKELLPKWLSSLIPLIPGLPAVVYGFLLPSAIQPLFFIVLPVVVFSTLAVIHLVKARIGRWSIKRSVRHLLLCTLGIVVTAILFFFAHATLIREYRHPPTSTQSSLIILPVKFHALPFHVTYPYLDCRRALSSTCDRPIPREAQSSRDFVKLLTDYGNFNIQPASGVPQLTSISLVLVLYAGITAQLVWVFGVSAKRGLSPKLILEEFGER